MAAFDEFDEFDVPLAHPDVTLSKEIFADVKDADALTCMCGNFMVGIVPDPTRAPHACSWPLCQVVACKRCWIRAAQGGRCFFCRNSCGERDQGYFPHKATADMRDTAKVRCPHEMCRWTGVLAGLNSHLRGGQCMAINVYRLFLEATEFRKLIVQQEQDLLAKDAKIMLGDHTILKLLDKRTDLEEECEGLKWKVKLLEEKLAASANLRGKIQSILNAPTSTTGTSATSATSPPPPVYVPSASRVPSRSRSPAYRSRNWSSPCDTPSSPVSVEE